MKLLVGSFYQFPCPIFLLLIQNITSIVIFKLLSLNGKIQVEAIDWTKVFYWFPLNLLFVIMLTTSSLGMKYLSVAMVTIFKNIQTICVALGDYLLFEEPLGKGSALSVIVMLVGSIIAGYNDLEFHTLGYFWILVNCFSGASYLV
uniref:Sugar phosphate transporter domain-containing protein n=1 Tax=Arcella intermedia TaxID=1963864 RepID=A0A6B2LMS3_9EUKA